MLRPFLHYGAHFLLPLAIAILFYKPKYLKVYLIFLCGFLIDLDHLWSTPIFHPNRCSINFHFLHSYYAIIVYLLLVVPKITRLLGIGLICHIIADSLDCFMMGI
ncbi:DUF6122 family protein [Aurantibacter sp.]|uniref:DUF6122 family protein n=1 Tax=Aurantibacter sp. TaxID=2807103 RepID=UPI0035C808E7